MYVCLSTRIRICTYMYMYMYMYMYLYMYIYMCTYTYTYMHMYMSYMCMYMCGIYIPAMYTDDLPNLGFDDPIWFWRTWPTRTGTLRWLRHVTTATPKRRGSLLCCWMPAQTSTKPTVTMRLSLLSCVDDFSGAALCFSLLGARSFCIFICVKQHVCER